MPFLPAIQKTDTLFTLFGLSFVIFGAALIGTLILYLGGKLLFQAPLDLKIALLAAVLSAGLIGYFSEPTIFSGRDQGSLSEAAFHLTQNSQLAFSTKASQSFFQIY